MKDIKTNWFSLQSRGKRFKTTLPDCTFITAETKAGEKLFHETLARTYGEEFPLLIEAHLLKKNLGQINTKYMTMDFVQRIRSQHKFKTPDDLSKQIAKDCEQAKEILGGYTKCQML